MSDIGAERRARASSARRSAGSVGCGGPARGGPVFPPPADLPEPQVLEERKADERHQRVVVQPAPSPALEVIEPELLLELLVRLLAAPARLDRRGQYAQRRARRVVGQVVLLLARVAPLADEP